MRFRSTRMILAAACLAALPAAGLGGQFHLKSRTTHKLYGPFEAVNGAGVRLGRSSYELIRGMDRFHLQDSATKRRYGPCLLEHGALLMIGKQSYELVLRQDRTFRYRPPSYPGVLPLIEDYLRQPAGQIQVAVAAVAMARRSRPEFDVEAYLGRLDTMAAELGERLAGVRTGQHTAAVMADYLFNERRLREETPRFRIPGVLKGGQDACVLFSFVYLALAERLDLPLYAVTAPQHVFVRYETSTERVNIETTNRGTVATDAAYRKRQGITRGAVAAGVYLRTLSAREFIAVLLHNRGVHAAGENRLDAALHDLNLAAAILPQDPEVMFNRGHVRERQGNSSGAFEDYSRALKRNPDHVRALLFRARQYSRRGEHVAAFRDSDRAVRLAPGDTATRCARGSAYLMLGDVPKAQADFEAARTADPKCAAAWLGLGSLYRRRGELDQALLHLDQALTLDPGLTDAWASRALVRAAQGSFDDALDTLGKAIGLEPADPRLYFARGVLHGSRLDKGSMLADLRRAIQLEPAMADLIRANKGFQRDWGDDPDFRSLVGQ